MNWPDLTLPPVNLWNSPEYLPALARLKEKAASKGIAVEYCHATQDIVLSRPCGRKTRISAPAENKALALQRAFELARAAK